ncbi:AbrB family transcriptional regulator [bacterium (Candidatus Howlettbacteria) CG_4_10_14_3_um_filter_37_10]|nr:MAG: AbrB family transcriptional regulator [bacterium (Candidatus Howlettbacteria) CG23_combo_of_CG06-09_8_20_14_all_37_9]PIX99090.1 MAG: AbrB family transcriptional regulator [bacterium (Candidatus Howlettbacteria) CG_4_10_14_3_um_filter_37_10]
MRNKKFYGSTTIGERGQIVVPAEARKDLNLDKGEKLLVFGMAGDSILITKVSSFKKFQEEMTQKQEEINKILKEI